MSDITPVPSTATTETTKPTPFRIGERYEWVTADDESLSGLAIYVRTSITNDERDALQDKHDAILEYNVAWAALSAQERAGQESPRDREWTLIAPYVKDWNVVGIDVDGNESPLPPPAVAGADVFHAVTPEITAWITRVLLLGYRFTGKAGGWQPKSTVTSGPRIAPNAE